MARSEAGGSKHARRLRRDAGPPLAGCAIVLATLFATFSMGCAFAAITGGGSCKSVFVDVVVVPLLLLLQLLLLPTILASARRRGGNTRAFAWVSLFGITAAAASLFVNWRDFSGAWVR